MPATHPEFLASAVRGDAKALGELLRIHGSSLRALVSGLIGAQWQRLIDADDVLQLTFTEVFLRIREFRGEDEAAFRAWLRRMARSNLAAALRGLRARKRGGGWVQKGSHGGGDDAATTLLGRLAGSGATPSRQMRVSEAKGLLSRGLERLPEDYRAVLQAYDLDGRSIEETARLLGKSTGAAYMIRARALERLRELLPSEVITTEFRVKRI